MHKADMLATSKIVMHYQHCSKYANEVCICNLGSHQEVLVKVYNDSGAAEALH